MRTSGLLLTPLFFAASALAQGPPEGIAPSSAPPSGCELNAGNFTIGTLKVGHTKRESALEAVQGALICTLKDGILRDRDARTGSVVANRQFQFDGPPQAGAIYTGGFSICSNGSLAIGGSTRWWQCSSGPFYNLYDEWIGAQCEEIRIQVTFLQKPSPSPSPSPSPTPSPSSSSAVVASSSSVAMASVESSLATITGPISTVSKTAIGPSASFTGLANASITASVSRTPSPSSLLAGSATPTGAADAPPAGGAAPVAFGVARGSMLGAFVVIFAAALIL